MANKPLPPVKANLLISLRTWQQRFINLVNTVPDAINADIVTGAGKTLAITAAYGLKLAPRYSRPLLVIGVPKLNLAYGWKNTARNLVNINLADTLNDDVLDDIENGYTHGIVLTYAWIQRNLNEIAKLCHNYDVVMVRDEAQWLGDNTWGAAFAQAVTDAKFHIGATGTPFRSVEGDRLWGFDYDQGKAVVDFDYDYQAALTDGVVPQIRWKALGGLIEWQQKKNGETLRQASRFGEDEEMDDEGQYVNQTLINRRLRFATYAGSRVFSPFLLDLLADADQRLREIRQTHSNAAGIVFAQSIEAAEHIADILRHRGNAAVLVHGKQANAPEVIQEFRYSDAEWLVSVDLIKEGTDIPRLRTAVLASHTTTGRQILQMVGRLLRLDPMLPPAEQTAEVFLPLDPRLVSIMELFDRTSMPDRKPFNSNPSGSSGSRTNTYSVLISIDADDVELELVGTIGTSGSKVKAQAEKFRPHFIASNFPIPFEQVSTNQLSAILELATAVLPTVFTTVQNHIQLRNTLASRFAARTGFPRLSCRIFADRLMRSVCDDCSKRLGNLPLGEDRTI